MALALLHPTKPAGNLYLGGVEERAAAEQERVKREHEDYLAQLRAKDSEYWETGAGAASVASKPGAQTLAISTANETADTVAWLKRARSPHYAGFEDLELSFEAGVAKRRRADGADSGGKNAGEAAASATATAMGLMLAAAEDEQGQQDEQAAEIEALERKVREHVHRVTVLHEMRLAPSMPGSFAGDFGYGPSSSSEWRAPELSGSGDVTAASFAAVAAERAALAAFGPQGEVERVIARSQEQLVEYALGTHVREEAARVARQAMLEVSDELDAEEEAEAAAEAAAGGAGVERRMAFNPAEDTLLQSAWGGGAAAGANDVVGRGFNVDILRKDVLSLCDGVWLNDEVMNFWFELLRERRQKRIAALAADNSGAGGERQHLCWNTFFCQKLMEGGYCYSNVKRWAKPTILNRKYPGVNSIFDFNRVLLPVHVGEMHWCLAVIFLPEHRIQYYDSMGGSGMSVLRALLRWLGDESRERLKAELDVDAWTLVPTQMGETPQQHNGCDCGVFTCTAADFISNCEGLDYDQQDMPHFRRRMAVRIMQGPGSLAREAGLD